MSHLLVKVNLEKAQLCSEQEFGYLTKNSATWLPVEVELPVICREKDFYIRSKDRIQSRIVIDIVDMKIIQFPTTAPKN